MIYKSREEKDEDKVSYHALKGVAFSVDSRSNC